MSTDRSVKEIVLRDLEPILQQTLGKCVIVDSFTTKSLLPFGENYGSTILSVDTTIRRHEKAEKEELCLIAKMPPPTEFQRHLFDSPFTFKKEIAMYEYIAPLYKKLQTECGIEENQVFDVWPKFYGSRLSLDPNANFDDDAVILMENLKVVGYYTCNRLTGFDVEHAKFVIPALAKFHALGIAIKQKKPNEFKVLRERSKCLNFKEEGWENVPQAMLKKMSEDPEILPYHSRCKEALLQDVQELWTAPPEEPWSTIIHADFWVNNIMFHRKDDNNQVDDIKFVDFQNYLFFSPLRELIFFLFSSVQTEVLEKYYEEFINLYHESLIDTLSRLNCDIEPYSLKRFESQLPFDAKREFAHICFMLKVLTLEVKETDYNQSDTEDVLKSYEGNQHFSDRLRHFILFFVKKNWI